jgi:hypothetical protein
MACVSCFLPLELRLVTFLVKHFQPAGFRSPAKAKGLLGLRLFLLISMEAGLPLGLFSNPLIPKFL